MKCPSLQPQPLLLGLGPWDHALGLAEWPRAQLCLCRAFGGMEGLWVLHTFPDLRAGPHPKHWEKLFSPLSWHTPALPQFTSRAQGSRGALLLEGREGEQAAMGTH